MSDFGYSQTTLDCIRTFQFALQELRDDQKTPENPLTDYGRTRILQLILDTCRISFKDWDYVDICVFLLCTYPREIFREAVRHCGGSHFVNIVFSNWRPPFKLYAFAIWEYVKRDADLFGDWLFLLPNDQKPSKRELGKVLFSDMVVSGTVAEKDCPSIAGALVPYPLESMFAREHEAEIDQLSRGLEAYEVGLLCRSLFLHRAIERSLCTCKYRERASEMTQCTCIANDRLDDEKRMIKLSNDLDKEYATVIFRLILERHDRDAVDHTRRWNQHERDSFVSSASDYVFCKEVYTEIYQNLHVGKKPTMAQQNARPLTEVEIRTNIARSADGDYDFSIAHHGGCVVRACPQAMKQDCANACCRTHCRSLGYNACNAHRFYTPYGAPKYMPRRSITVVPEHLHSGGRGAPTRREGNI
ncbi:hypothetical protein BWQ96_06675 [Gracilariopsis chorda]|uniref:Uncharacterized protein n=1 Tax=Gracilariopsis chorda TaxID=448386 RepID=A0A2V3INB7_9FLOR|nr:hypothetical protein BWQ96_06675 [Gracilariopsis chorda]|eukprot:PXF43563.1 hypothetical protein BWQ96_06675 [Gracilariopsis chorda]